MELLDDENKNIISNDTVNEILNIIISFVFRRMICEVPTNALNKIFMVLGKEIKKYDNYKDNYLEIFKYIIIKKRLSQRFPDDEEFASKLILKDIYNLKSKNRLFLLEQLENFNNKERVDIENLLSLNTLNIEHIMPQKLTKEWRRILGENYEVIHEKYLHTIGNITLTGYNSKMSNKSFLEKRDMENGFKDSRLYLNQDLKDLDTWNEVTIINRANKLKNRVLEIWSYPKTSYQSQEDKEKTFSLSDDDINFAGQKIISFKFMDEKEIKTKSWKEFYTKIIKILSELDLVKLKQILIKNNFIYNENSSTSKDKHYKIDNIYIYTILDTETMLSRLRVIINEIGLDLDDIVFTIN